MLAEAMTNVSSRFALRRGWPSQPARHTPINAIMMHPATCVCRSDDRSCLNFALAFGRVAQPDRASGFEAEGCRFKSCLGHQRVARFVIVAPTVLVGLPKKAVQNSTHVQNTVKLVSGQVKKRCPYTIGHRW